MRSRYFKRPLFAVVCILLFLASLYFASYSYVRFTHLLVHCKIDHGNGVGTHFFEAYSEKRIGNRTVNYIDEEKLSFFKPLEIVELNLWYIFSPFQNNRSKRSIIRTQTRKCDNGR